ncbi:histidine phosphatase family protein [Actinocatenispora sera]|uniref:histidine phosphatase family protein n=1 Tax=Actinocatenispora sera TaxID=390989 RepID=UPI0033FB2544
MSRRIVLVRHGQSTANVDHSLTCAIPGVPLSPLGERQVVRLAADWPAEYAPDTVWSSPMARAMRTAEPIAARYRLPVRVHPAGHEALIGTLHGSTDPADAALVATTFARWRDDPTPRLPGGEDGTDLVHRLRTVLLDVLADLPAGGTAVLVGHGTLFAVAVPRLAAGLSRHVPELPNAGRAVLEAPDTGTAGLIAARSEAPAADDTMDSERPLRVLCWAGDRRDEREGRA